MKIFFSLLFILTLFSAALADVGIEVHDDHGHASVADVAHGHEHDHAHAPAAPTEGAESSEHCAHYHIHCASLCLGVLFAPGSGPGPIGSRPSTVSFRLATLAPQEYASPLYRPPIA